jgi:hypothetical protein
MINKKIIIMHIISITDVLSFRQEKLGERTRSEISFTGKKTAT